MEKYVALLMLRSKLNLWSTQTELYGATAGHPAICGCWQTANRQRRGRSRLSAIPTILKKNSRHCRRQVQTPLRVDANHAPELKLDQFQNSSGDGIWSNGINDEPKKP